MHRGYEYRRNSVHAVLMRHGNVQGTLELYDQELLHASSSAQRGKLTIAATPYLASPFVQNTKRCAFSRASTLSLVHGRGCQKIF